MLGLRPSDRPLRLVCIGAHADDIEIGAGGTVRRLLAEHSVEVTWAVASADGARADEARAAASEWLDGARSAVVEIGAFRDGYFPAQRAEIKDWFKAALAPAAPDLVLTHRRDDAHQDHRTLGELTTETFRGPTVAYYEIPKWDGDLARPSAYVTLTDAEAAFKTDALLRHFHSQHAKPWYDADTFRAMLRIRGVEAGARWAEAFTVDKLIW